MREIIIKGFSNVTKEGVVLELNQKAKLRTGFIESKEFFISWDKIGSALFKDYTESIDFDHLAKLRK